MKRREFMTLLGCATLCPLPAGAQTRLSPGPGLNNQSQDTPAPNVQTPDDHVAQVATLQGTATVTRGNAASAALKVNDPIFKNDVLQTGANASLGVTFDDETTLNLSANARIAVNEFVYQEGGGSNSAVFNVIRGTVAFVAGQAAKTGNMTMTMPNATLGIRGTTGVVDVPDGAAEPKIKLYPDSDGRIGRIEVFDRQGGSLGALTQGASAFSIRPGVGGRFAAVPFQIPPQEAARDRGVVQRLFASHNIGRRMAIQRRQTRSRNLQRQNNQRINNQRQNNLRQPGGQQQNRNPALQQQQPQRPRGLQQQELLRPEPRGPRRR